MEQLEPFVASMMISSLIFWFAYVVYLLVTKTNQPIPWRVILPGALVTSVVMVVIHESTFVQSAGTFAGVLVVRGVDWLMENERQSALEPQDTE